MSLKRIEKRTIGIAALIVAIVFGISLRADASTLVEIERGETLDGIAAAHAEADATTEDILRSADMLAALNGIAVTTDANGKRSALIVAGEVLDVGLFTDPTYVVVKGDTVWKILRRMSPFSERTALEEAATVVWSANALDDRLTVYPGQALNMRAVNTQPNVAVPSHVITVQPDDTLGEKARLLASVADQPELAEALMYIIADLNGINDIDVLRAGMELRTPVILAGSRVDPEWLAAQRVRFADGDAEDDSKEMPSNGQPVPQSGNLATQGLVGPVTTRDDEQPGDLPSDPATGEGGDGDPDDRVGRHEATVSPEATTTVPQTSASEDGEAIDPARENNGNAEKATHPLPTDPNEAWSAAQTAATIALETGDAARAATTVAVALEEQAAQAQERALQLGTAAGLSVAQALAEDAQEKQEAAQTARVQAEDAVEVAEDAEAYAEEVALLAADLSAETFATAESVSQTETQEANAAAENAATKQTQAETTAATAAQLQGHADTLTQDANETAARWEEASAEAEALHEASHNADAVLEEAKAASDAARLALGGEPSLSVNGTYSTPQEFAALVSRIVITPAEYESFTFNTRYENVFAESHQNRTTTMEGVALHFTGGTYNSDVQAFLNGISSNPACSRGCSVQMFIPENASAVYKMVPTWNTRALHIGAEENRYIGIEMEGSSNPDLSLAQVRLAIMGTIRALEESGVGLDGDAANVIGHAESDPSRRSDWEEEWMVPMRQTIAKHYEILVNGADPDVVTMFDISSILQAFVASQVAEADAVRGAVEASVKADAAQLRADEAKAYADAAAQKAGDAQAEASAAAALAADAQAEADVANDAADQAKAEADTAAQAVVDAKALMDAAAAHATAVTQETTEAEETPAPEVPAAVVEEPEVAEPVPTPEAPEVVAQEEVSEEPAEVIEEPAPAVEEAGWTAPSMDQVRSELSDEYHEVLAQMPTLEYAIEHYNSRDGDPWGPSISLEDAGRVAYLADFDGDEELIWALETMIGEAGRPDGNGEIRIHPYVIGDWNISNEGDLSVGAFQIRKKKAWTDPVRDPENNLHPEHNAESAESLEERQGRGIWSSADRIAGFYDEAREALVAAGLIEG